MRYMELRIGPEVGKELGLRVDRLHIFPRPNQLIVSIPNRDGSFAGMLLFQDKRNENVLEDFVKSFPKIAALLPNLLTKLKHQTPSSLVSIRLKEWRLADKFSLIGDSGHAIYPFYGQGMNMALEDAFILSELLEKHDVGKAFEIFEQTRKPEADAIDELSRSHFSELYERSAMSWSLSSSSVHRMLNRIMPCLWPHEYQSIASGSHSLVEVKRRQKFQKMALKLSCVWLIDIIIRGVRSHCANFARQKLFLRRM